MKFRTTIIAIYLFISAKRGIVWPKKDLPENSKLLFTFHLLVPKDFFRCAFQ